MPQEGLSSFILNYISERKQPKREALEKEESKALAGLESPVEQTAIKNDFASRYAEIEKKYEVHNWLTDAARRAGQISLVTHALKFTHGDAKGSSIYNPSADKELSYLSSASLKTPVLDAVGNAASLAIVKMLQTEYQGDSLLACLIRNDTSALAALADNEQQLTEWVEGFKQVLSNLEPVSHKLAKQIYFPVGGNHYHLLSPLFPTSLVQALHKRIMAARFSEEAKEVYAAFKNETWHSQPRISYFNTAVQTFGGTQPQNISYLNTVRGGKVRLLSCAAPVWQNINKPPLKHKSVFHSGSEFSRMAYTSVGRLKYYLLSVYDKESTFEIRQQRESFVDEIIDILFNYVAGVHQFENPGWSAENECELKRSQQLWLDPLRSKTDEAFCFEREAGDWKKEIARDFGHWLSQQLSSSGSSGQKHSSRRLAIADPERRYFSTAALFKKRLREMEQAVKEDLLCI